MASFRGRCASYVGAVVLAATVAAVVAAARRRPGTPRMRGSSSLLLGCGLISVAATPRVVYRQGGMTRDFLTVWVLPDRDLAAAGLRDA